MLLQCVGLELQTVYLFEPPGPDFRPLGILRAYHTAMALIGKMFEADNECDLIRYVPGYITRMTFIAAIVLFEITNSSNSHYIDLDKCKHSHNSTLFVMHRALMEDNDLQGKSSNVLTQIWTVYNTLSKDEETRLKLDTRAGISGSHDILKGGGEFGEPLPEYQSPLCKHSETSDIVVIKTSGCANGIRQMAPFLCHCKKCIWGMTSRSIFKSQVGSGTLTHPPCYPQTVFRCDLYQRITACYRRQTSLPGATTRMNKDS